MEYKNNLGMKYCVICKSSADAFRLRKKCKCAKKDVRVEDGVV